MNTNKIIFADLSTYEPLDSMAFYEKVFGWSYKENESYYWAYTNNDQIASGLYETPEKFKQMRMPHFWMTYIEVTSVSKIVDRVKKMNGTIELVDDRKGEKMALVRDPQGAGFTIYERGNIDRNTRTIDVPNTLISNELHLSNIRNVIPFYTELFDWKFTTVQGGYYQILHQDNTFIANALELPNSLKGKYEYWVCSFGVSNLERTAYDILHHGGRILSDERKRILCTDNSQQAFFYIQEI